jgi:hypothetical protein
MANRRAKGAAIIFLAAGALMAPEQLSAEPVPSVVLRVHDYHKLPAGDLMDAEKIVTGIYERVGVHLVWIRPRSGRSAIAASALDIVILSADMTELMKPDPDACGRASAVLVLAHEVGHLLLPANSHARFGLMKPTMKGRILLIPDFTPEQGRTIRARLSSKTKAVVGSDQY